MGVAGAGKSVVGEVLAERLGVPFVDGDALHPASNVAKMAGGTPLTDEDRWPWLRTVGETLQAAHATGMVLACSALRVAYRDAIREVAPETLFVHLHGTPELHAERIGGRPGHFMPPALLTSQLALLEPLGPDEAGATIDIAPSVDEIAAIAAHAVLARS